MALINSVIKRSFILITLFFLCTGGGFPANSKDESFRVAPLPSFRHNKNYIELQGITTLDLLLQSAAKIVRVEVNGVENNKVEIDKKSGKVFGLEIIPIQRLKNSHINNNGIYHKRNKKRVINKTTFNLAKSSAKPLLIEGKDFKIFKVPVRGILSGSYTLRVVVDSAQKATTQVITKENFRIDSISPSVIDTGVESQLTILGKGLDLFTDVSFYDPNGKEVQVINISEVESLDESTLKIKVLIPGDYTPGFHNVTVTNSFRPNETSTLLNGLFIGSKTGASSTNGIGVCDDPAVSLMINAIELLPQGKSTTVFDPTLCQLTVGIPRSKDEERAVEEVDISSDQISNGSMSFCSNPTGTLMVFTNNLSPGSQASTFFDPAQCNLTFGIPVGFNGVNGESGANGMGLCNDRNTIPIAMTVTIPATSAATIDLDPQACVITYGIPQGETGSQGESGFSCWDLNSNRVCDLSTEDKNKDGQCNPFDCQGASGEAGIDCWDLNENRLKDLNEDINRDGFVDIKDCIGTTGATGTTGTTGASGLNSLVSTTSELAGLNCITGGKKIQNGLDSNNNGVLDSSEVSQTEYICNGTTGVTGATGVSGLNSLVKTTDEPIGSNCVTGGKKIQTGLDSNNNGLLDSSEISQTEYVCNGVTGATGAIGVSGTNGSNSLVKTTDEPAGPNCNTGGVKVQSGLDSNNNGVLNSSEISQTAYICDGEKGESGTSGLNSLVVTTDEPIGSNCVSGGEKIQSGLDSNNNGVLDSLEISQTEYVCNGTTGTIGTTGLSGINCWDLNGNRINDSNEDINMDGLFNTYDCNSPQIKLLEEVIVDWINDSSDQNLTIASGDMTRMIKIPYFIHDGIIYGGFWIDKYEVSRADASSIAEGTSSIPVSKRNVVPWTNLTLAEAQAAAAGRQIADIGECHLIKMREWYALYLLGRYSKEKGILGATDTSGWNERGNTRSGKDGRNNLLFTCADDPVEGIGTGRCLTGTGYKSWGHFLDSTAVSNIGLGVSPGFGALVSADLVKDDGDGSGVDTFDGDFQVYDLVGNVKEWIDFTVTRTQSGTIIDPTYQGANESLPFTLNNTFFTFTDVATGSDTAQIDFEGLGLPIRGTNTNVTDLNGGANDGKLITSTTSQQYGTIRGGSWTTGSSSRSPLYLNIGTTPTTQETERGFRVTCGF